MRQSNMEAVRILAMSMILIWHFFIHGGILYAVPSAWSIVPFIIGGVNLFILISGYFHIRFKIKSLLHLAFIVLGFQYFMIFMGYTITDTTTSFKSLLYMMLAPLTANQYWFIQMYFILYIISPVINKGLTNMSLSEVRWLILIMFVVLFYSCGYFNHGVNIYNFYTFLCLYVLGHYLRVEPLVKRLNKRAVIIGLSISLLLGVAQAYFIGVRSMGDVGYLYNYSNPLITAIAVFILLLFLKYPFSSNVVNKIAYCALGCYLLQDGAFQNIAYSYLDALCHNKEWTELTFTCILFFVGYWIASYVLFKIFDILFKHLYRFVHMALKPAYAWLNDKLTYEE